jgi:hypothetical protein
MTKAQIDKLVAAKKGILLDISMGGTPQERSVTLSPKGDIPYDPTWRTFHPELGLDPAAGRLRRLASSFPLPDGCVNTAVVTHVLEWLDPARFFDWWDELWRVMQPHGIVYVSGPYGGDDSQGWLSDPGHRTRVLETSFAWLDPRTPLYEIHDQVGRPRPRPWRVQTTARVPGTQGSISYNATCQKADPEEFKAK